MKSNYRKIGDFIQQVNTKNEDGSIELLLGVNLDKVFINSVANTIGTDMTKYKVIKKGQFGCKLMSVGRDKKLPISRLVDYEKAIISSAYYVFEVIDENQLNPEYLMMWFSRPESDRYLWFQSGGDVRGRITWDDLCELPIKVPSIEKQRDIVKEYNTIVNRITLNETLNQKLEETAQALYKNWFVDFEFPNAEGKPYKSSGGKMSFNEELDLEIPEGWEDQSFTKALNLKGGGTPSTTNPNYWNGEIPFFTPKDVIDSYYSTQTEKNITNIGLKNCSSKLFPKNTIFVTARGTVGAVSIAAYDMAMNQSCYAIIEERDINYCYAHQLTLETLKTLINQASGAVFKALVTKDFNEFYLAKPTSKILKLFHKTVEPFYISSLNKAKQNQKLENMRDLLLSKMSKVESKQL